MIGASRFHLLSLFASNKINLIAKLHRLGKPGFLLVSAQPTQVATALGANCALISGRELLGSKASDEEVTVAGLALAMVAPGRLRFFATRLCSSFRTWSERRGATYSLTKSSFWCECEEKVAWVAQEELGQVSHHTQPQAL